MFNKPLWVSLQNGLFPYSKCSPPGQWMVKWGHSVGKWKKCNFMFVFFFSGLSSWTLWIFLFIMIWWKERQAFNSWTYTALSRALLVFCKGHADLCTNWIWTRSWSQTVNNFAGSYEACMLYKHEKALSLAAVIKFRLWLLWDFHCRIAHMKFLP